MKKLVSSLLLSLVVTVPAHAGIIGFEDLGGTTFLSGQYQGLNWTGTSGGTSWVVGDASDPDGFEGEQAHSGNYFVWNNGGNANLTISGTAFNLASVWVRGGSGDRPLTFRGFNNGVETFNSNFESTLSYQQVVLNFTGIDSLLIETGSRNILFDDFNIEPNAVPDPVPVPEPVSAALLGLGLVSLGIFRRRAKR